MSDIKELSGAQILRQYFPPKDSYKDQSGLKGFMAEMKELKAEDRKELVELAAKELGVKVKE
jgi:hypothetical protein